MLGLVMVDVCFILPQNALKKYGVKPLPKKKARLKLKEIYCHTHQGSRLNSLTLTPEVFFQGTFLNPSKSYTVQYPNGTFLVLRQN